MLPSIIIFLTLLSTSQAFVSSSAPSRQQIYPTQRYQHEHEHSEIEKNTYCRDFLTDVRVHERSIESDSCHQQQRRAFLTIGISCCLPFFAPSPSHALQKKNEALCGTGFFEHFNEFRCTAIGDISDEGNSRKLKDDEVNATDSLMSKMGLSLDDLGEVDINKTSQKNNEDLSISSGERAGDKSTSNTRK